MTYTPVPLPIIIPTESEPDVCPECGRSEDIKRVCRHCGYEYPESSEDFRWYHILAGIVFILLAVVLFCWILWTLIEWLSWSDSLVDVLKDQWEWLKSIRIW